MNEGGPFWRAPSVLASLAALVVVVATDAVLRHTGGSPADFTLFLGRFHPLAVHLPIGIVLLVGAAEAATLWPRLRPRVDPALSLALPLLVAATAGAFVLGQLLARSGDFAPRTLTLHRRLELFASVGICLLPLAWAYQERARSERARWGYRTLLGIALGVLSLGAHFGGTLTRGDTYLTRYAPAPFKRLLGAAAEPAPTVAAKPKAAEPRLFSDVIQPIFNERCVSCHGSDKVKGGLRLDSLDAIAKGGEDGSVVKPGDPAQSPLLQRVMLPASDDDHMPPEDKPGLTPPEIAAVRFWIERGANDSLVVRDLLAPNEARTLLERSLTQGHATPTAVSPTKAADPASATSEPSASHAPAPSAPPTTGAPAHASTPTATTSTPPPAPSSDAPPTAKPSEAAPSSATAILAERCSKCHGAAKQKGKLRVDSLDALTHGGKSGPAVVAGQPSSSLLVQRISLAVGDEKHMPPAKEVQLSARDIATLSAWIRDLNATPHAASTGTARRAAASGEPASAAASAPETAAAAATSVPPTPEAASIPPAAAPTPGDAEPAPAALLAGLPSRLALYPSEIAPLLHAHCAKCHAGDKPAGGLAVDSYATLLTGGDTGPAVTPGQPEASLLVRRLGLPQDDSDHMPPSDEPQLTSNQLALVNAWVARDGTADHELELSTLPAPALRAIAEQPPARAAADVAQAAPHATGGGCGACMLSRRADQPGRGAAAGIALFFGLFLRRRARTRSASFRCR